MIDQLLFCVVMMLPMRSIALFGSLSETINVLVGTIKDPLPLSVRAQSTFDLSLLLSGFPFGMLHYAGQSGFTQLFKLGPQTGGKRNSQ